MLLGIINKISFNFFRLFPFMSIKQDTEKILELIKEYEDCLNIKEFKELKRKYEVGKEPQDLLDVLNSEAKEQELHSKIQEANAYLLKTDWVTIYKLKHDIGLELIPLTSSKWDIIKKRESFINYLKGLS